MSLVHRLRRPSAAVAAGALLTSVLLYAAFTAAPHAAAATSGTGVSPVVARTASQVSAKALPTVQIDGVVWTQAIVGNTVYAGGQFSTARPAGAAPGVSTTPRSNILAYDITTGNLVTSFAPVINGVVRAITASPDGSRIYVGGQFTASDGVKHNRIVAYSIATGAVINSFTPNLDASVYAITATNTTVYIGGIFSTANGVARARLAALNASNGALTTWNPGADGKVAAMLLTPDGTKVVVGGSYANLAGNSDLGLGAVDAVTGAFVPWEAGTKIRETGNNAGVTSLSTDGTTVYGTVFDFAADPTVSNLEGPFAADPTTGALRWIADCHGDTYSGIPINGALYTVGHAHYCAPVGGYPNYSGAITSGTQRANAYTLDASGVNQPEDSSSNYGFPWAGTPSPSLIGWFPTVATGTFTGQSQAAWSVTGNSKYIALGGELTAVNGTAQQGLVRFANSSVSTQTAGPVPNTLLAPTAAAGAQPGTAHIAFDGTWDRDDLNLTYRVYRDGATAPIFAESMASTFWHTPRVNFADTGLAAGNHTYLLTVSDPNGTTISATATTTVAIAVGGVPPAPSANLALGKPVWQSTLYPGGEPSKAVDGNVNGNWAAGSVSLTALGDQNAWWEVDLGSSQSVSTITLNGRSDCCSAQTGDYWVFTSNTPFNTSLTAAEQATQPGVQSSYQPGAAVPAATISLAAGSTARYVLVQHGTIMNDLALGEVSVSGTPVTGTTNLALGKVATMSSTMTYGGIEGAASHANDGNTDGVWSDGSVIDTMGTEAGWWQVDLGSAQPLSEIDVWNRTDCCSANLSDYWVFISSTPFDTTLPASQQAMQPGVWSSHRTVAPSPEAVIPVAAGTTGRYVMVKLAAKGFLTLAEVAVH